MPRGAKGAVLTVTGTALVTGYVASSAIPVSGAQCIRFFVKSVRSAGSGATTTTAKLQMRYNDGTSTTTYVDLPSHLDDVQGAAQPKGQTFEIEHVFTTSASATTVTTFVLKKPQAISDITVNVKVNATGQAGDSTTVYASVV